MGPLQEFLANVETHILNPLITLLALLAFLYFIWGIVVFVQNADNDEKRKVGQQHMLWGLIGLVVIFGAQAIIGIIASTIGVR